MNLNQIILVGRLAKDPMFTPGKVKPSNNRLYFKVIVNHIRGEGYDAIPCVCWGKLADVGTEYLEKGKEVTITGELRVDNKRNEDGTYNNNFNVSVSKISFGPKTTKSQQTQPEQLAFEGEDAIEDVATETQADALAAAAALPF